MAFFKSKDTPPDKWKDKYLQLLESQEQLENDYKANEDLLCKTIIRFSIAVKGLNRELDPHLSRIRNLLKNGVKNKQLQRELEEFSTALISLEDPTHEPLDASGLFKFLREQYPNNKSKLIEFEEKFDRRDFTDSQQLFNALQELIDTSPALDKPPDLAFSQAELQAISGQLLNLMDCVQLPEAYQAQAEDIKTRLQSGFDAKSINPMLDETINLLLEVKQQQASEQREMAIFLSKLHEQLAELGAKATGASIANTNAVKKRNLLDQTVAGQIQDLQAKTANITQLESLKQLVHSRLADINEQIQSHYQQEQAEREIMHNELSALCEKINTMESESRELKQKLAAAQDKAIHDPLTLLPNRLALEERLQNEIARWRRNRRTMSLIVWDIDYFKKINDTYGHKSGDKALMIIARLLAKQCRETDFVARFGGEEFVMLLPDTDAKSALIVADKLRENLAKASFNANGEKISITLSAGISQLIEGDSSESIFERADKALYQAKHNGRNQCQVT